MKILKIFGVVVGIHVFALILIFANPGCSSTSKSIPAPSDTMIRADTAPAVSVPMISRPAPLPADPGPAFNPDAPALAASSSSSGVRFTPTRPGTAAASTLVIEPVVDVTPATSYTVTAGDNLWSLSRKFHISTAEIAGANGLKTNVVLRPGQKLVIPSKPAMAGASAAAPAGTSTFSAAGTAAKTPEAGATRAPTETVKHVVKAGESLSAIAQMYGVRQGSIAEANNITDPQKIRVGTELTIPGWQPTGKSGKATPRPATKAPASKGSDARTPVFAPETDPSATKPPASSDVPVIHIDDSPITPAPKAP